MESYNWNFLLGILTVVVVIGSLYIFRSRPRCPECKSYKVGIVKKEPQTSISHVQPLGNENGVQVTATVYYQVQYRCGDCEETWMITVAESK